VSVLEGSLSLDFLNCHRFARSRKSLDLFRHVERYRHVFQHIGEPVFRQRPGSRRASSSFWHFPNAVKRINQWTWSRLKKHSLTRAQLEQLADIPLEEEWLALRGKRRNRRWVVQHCENDEGCE